MGDKAGCIKPTSDKAGCIKPTSESPLPHCYSGVVMARQPSKQRAICWTVARGGPDTMRFLQIGQSLRLLGETLLISLA